MSQPKKSKKNQYKLIYNPYAGKKRQIFSENTAQTLENIKTLLAKYQIPTDFYPSKSAEHATSLAKEAKDEGYKYVLVAGGDGTVGQVANGLVNTSITMGILPLGTFMNVARMLAIPTDIEQAVMLLRIGRVRKIDVGKITKMDGEKVEEPTYFLESAGIGLDAQIQQIFLDFDKKKIITSLQILREFFDFYKMTGNVTIDEKKIETKSTIVTVANGPYGGAVLKLAPDAKLNDKKLTVVLYEMSKGDLMRYMYNMVLHKKTDYRKIKTYQGEKVTIHTKNERLIHADARVFGTTPAEFTIIPTALAVISGFNEPTEESAFKTKTFLHT